MLLLAGRRQAKKIVVALSLLLLTRHCGPKPERGYELGVVANDEYRKL